MKEFEGLEKNEKELAKLALAINEMWSDFCKKKLRKWSIISIILFICGWGFGFLAGLCLK